MIAVCLQEVLIWHKWKLQFQDTSSLTVADLEESCTDEIPLMQMSNSEKKNPAKKFHFVSVYAWKVIVSLHTCTLTHKILELLSWDIRHSWGFHNLPGPSVGDMPCASVRLVICTINHWMLLCLDQASVSGICWNVEMFLCPCEDLVLFNSF